MHTCLRLRVTRLFYVPAKIMAASSSSLSKILYQRVTGDSENDGKSSPGRDEDLSEPSSKKHCPEPEKLTEIRGVIFDMDGTLTLPVLDFAEMRSRLKLTPNQDILPTVQKYPPEQRAKAMAIIEECEDEGLKMLQLQPGLLDLLHFIAERNLPRGVITRNSSKAAKAFLDKLHKELKSKQDGYPHLKEDEIFSEEVRHECAFAELANVVHVINSHCEVLRSHDWNFLTRDFEPCKPDPAPVLHICRQWSLEPNQVVLVGDDKTDMKCGIRAGTGVNILLRNKRNKTQVDFSNFAVDSLSEVVDLFSSTMSVTPKSE